jgi:DNA-binding transcriptional MerR regulator/methylmalonyl-CoA mutase cobalamin-binding subunit
MFTDLDPRHPIRVVAQRTGLSPATLRAWERRYQVVEPGRSAGGQRLYSDRDVERLRRLHQLTEAGRPISLVASLPDEALEELQAEDRGRRYVPPAPPSTPGTTVHAADAMVASALERVGALDGDGLEAVLRRATVTLGGYAFLEDVVTPLLHRVGEAWARDALGPAHEHLCTGVIEGVLAWLHEPVAGGADGPRLVVATLPGERHGLGAMLVAAAAGLEGWQVTYLGVDLPAAEIARAARMVGARAVALSVVNADATDLAVEGLGELRLALGPGVGLLVGGGAADRMVGRLPAGVERLDGLSGLGEALDRLA